MIGFIINSLLWGIGFIVVLICLIAFIDYLYLTATAKFKKFCRKNKLIQKWLNKGDNKNV